MADESVPAAAPTPPAPETPEAPTPPASPPAPDERISGLEARLDRLTQVLEGGLGRQVQPQSPQQPAMSAAQLSPQERAFLRREGMSDADIDSVYGLVAPVSRMMLAQVAPEVVSLIQQNRDDLETVKAERNTKQYPDWNTTIDKAKGLTIADKVHELRETASKNGQGLSVRNAYEAAVALNVDAVVTARETARKSSPAHDATIQGSLGRNQGGVRGGPAGPMTREQVRAMSPEERKAYWDKIGDTPIH